MGPGGAACTRAIPSAAHPPDPQLPVCMGALLSEGAVRHLAGWSRTAGGVRCRAAWPAAGQGVEVPTYGQDVLFY